MNKETEQPAGGVPVDQGAGATPQVLLARIGHLLETVVQRIDALESWQRTADETLAGVLPAAADRIAELGQAVAIIQADLKMMDRALASDHELLRQALGAAERRPPTGSGAGVN